MLIRQLKQRYDDLEADTRKKYDNILLRKVSAVIRHINQPIHKTEP